MSILNHSDLSSDISSNIYNNGSQLITGNILQTRLINLADSAVNKLGDTGIAGLLRYSSVFSISNNADIVHKKYVDDSILAIDFSPYLEKNGSVTVTGNFNWGGYGISNISNLSNTSGSDSAGINFSATEVESYFSSGANISRLKVNIGGVGIITLGAGHTAYLRADNLTAHHILQLPNTSDTLATLSDIPSLTGYLTNTLNSAKIFVGNGSNIATEVAMSGDITINNSGVTAIGAGKVTNAMLAGSIAYSKLLLTGSIINADLAGGIDLTSKVTGLLPDANISSASTWNAKEPAIASGTTAQYFRGDKSWRDFFTDVRAATLTGLSTGTNAVITATDTVLSALGKLQKQISDNLTTYTAWVTNAPYLTPEMYGALGDGSTDDYTAIQSCLDAGNTLNKAVHFKRGNTYIVGKVLTFHHKQVIVGNKATIKRKNVRSTTLSAVAGTGATSITVTDPSIFSVGDKFIVLNNGATYGGAGYGENSLNSATPQIVSSIVGSVINFTNSIQMPISGGTITQFPIGSTVVIIHDLMTYDTTVVTSDSGGAESIVIRDLIFDGNKSSNNLTYDWRVVNTIQFRVPYGIIENCEFINTPSENIVVGANASIVGNKGKDLNGSFCHVSISVANDLTQGVRIESNRIINSNVIGNPIMSHSEGAITFSANVQRLRIIDNRFYNINGYLFGGGSDGASTTDIVFERNQCYSANNITTFSTAASSFIIEDLIIRNNKFIDCGGIKMDSGTFLKKGGGINRIKIHGNTFRNTWMYLYGSDIEVKDNKIRIETTYSFPTPINNNRDACVFAIGYNIDISGNDIDGKASYDANCRYGIMVLSDGVVKSDASTNTLWGYTQNVDIVDNIVTGFVNGIATEISTYATSQTYSRVNWNIKGNQVVLCDKGSATFSYGIYASAGVVCFGNTVYGVTGTTYLYVVLGVNPATSGIATACLGAIARFNVGISPTNVGFFVGGSPNTTNALCEFNVCSGNSDANAFFDNSGGAANTILANNRRTNTIGVAQPSPVIIRSRDNSSYY